MLIHSDSSNTITKTRINSSKKQILRIDEDNGYDYEKEIYKKFFENFKNYDSILISDYQKGTLRDVKKIIMLANKLNKRINLRKIKFWHWKGRWKWNWEITNKQIIVSRQNKK